MRPHLWSFGFKGIPSDQHFTLAKNEKSGINFHITKNIKDSEGSDKKPRIPILNIDKEVISSDLNSLFLIMFFEMLNEIDIKEKEEFSFLSFEEVKQDKPFGENDEDFFKKFKEVSRIIRKTRLKVDTSWKGKLLELNHSEKLIDSIKRNTKSIGSTKLKDIDGGILMDEEKTLAVIKIYERWYEFSPDKKPIEIIKRIIDEQLAKSIWYKIRRAIVILKSVDSWKDVENKYQPISIVLNKS